MKKITFLLFLLISTLGYTQTSNYCSTEVLHLNIAAETASAFDLTIVNTGASTMKVTAANADISFLDLIGSITGDPTKSDADNSVSGEISITLTWATAAPNDVTFQFIQWRKAGAATWQINDATTPFSGVCAVTPLEEDATLSNLTVDGTTVTDFAAGTLSYNVELPEGTTVVPMVVGTPTQSSPATAVTTAATELPGATTILVTAQDLSTTKTYTINFTVAAPIAPPTVAPPSPPVRNAADVVSIYSDAYAAISPINYDEAWCGTGAVTATTADGDNVFAYNGQPCQGIGFASDIQDVTGLTNMHVDLFIAEGTDLVGKVFNVKIVYSAGGETSFNIDINALIPAPVPGTWYSYDAPITITGSNIQQVGITSNLNNVVWYDNLYFWKEAVDPVTDTTLSNLTVDGTTVTGFETDKLTYNIILPKGTTVVPTIVGTPTQSSPASAVTTAATELPGTSTVLVTAQDGTTTETYTVNFTVDTNTECEGFSSDSQQQGFSNGGYSYAFETLANGDVRMTFELLEVGADGVVAYSWKEQPFQELQMTVTGTVATIDLTGYSDGEVISHAVKFIWASGGFGVTKYFTYTVGENCGGASEDTTLEDATLSDLTVNGTTVSSFLASTLTYDIELPYGTIAVPTVVGTATQSTPANAVTTDATTLPGTSTILVTAQDGTTTSTYTLNFTVAGPSVTLPLDFSDASQAFQWDASGGTGGNAIINTTSGKLEIFGNGNEWDNAFIAFSGTDVVDLSNDAANTITFTIQSTTALAGEVHTHLMKLTGAGVYETDFTTTGQEVKTVFIDPPALGDLTELRIFVDKGSTDGGTYLVDDIALFVDTEAPTAFTATVGTIGAFGVELLLNATDNSGSVTYDISYNGGANSVQTIGTSGVEKSFTISGLTPETVYSFEVSASDGTGNIATNNPITGLDATTLEDTSNECAGTSSDSSQPGFSNGGYSYAFETLANGDVRMTFELLEVGADGVVAYSWKEQPFQELQMTVTGTVATIDLTGYSDGEVISHAVKFVWASGGFGVTKYFTYTVGEDCSTLGTNDFDLASFSTYPNPTKNSWTVKTQNVNMLSIKVYDILGKNVLSLSPNTSETVIDGSNLKTGLYFAQIKTETGIQRLKLVKN